MAFVDILIFIAGVLVLLAIPVCIALLIDWFDERRQSELEDEK